MRDVPRTAISGSQIEELVDKSDLKEDISSTHPPNLPLPHHVNRLIALKRSLRRLECSEPLLGVHPAFDPSMVLLHRIPQLSG